MHALGLESVIDHPAGAQSSHAHLSSQQELVDKLTMGVKITGLSEGYLHASRLVARELGLAPGQTALLVNGRVSLVW
jgi:UDP-glucose:glycoprotein glucosyltransferase